MCISVYNLFTKFNISSIFNDFSEIFFQNSRIFLDFSFQIQAHSIICFKNMKLHDILGFRDNDHPVITIYFRKTLILNEKFIMI